MISPAQCDHAALKAAWWRSLPMGEAQTSVQRYGVRQLDAEPAAPVPVVAEGASLLAPQQLEFFNENGFTEGHPFLTPGGLAWCRSNIDRLIEEMSAGQPERPLADLISPHQCPGGGWLWQLIAHPACVAAAQQQIGEDVVCWSTHLLIKEPGSGFDVPWHQDAPYWNMHPSSRMAAAVWLALDDVDEESGTMSVLPGYHRHGALPRVLDARKYFAQHIDPDALPADVEQRKVTYRMKAGEAALHHVLVPHSSGANRSDRWRRVIVLRYIAADAELGVGDWRDYRGEGAPFPREYFLVGGEDRLGRGYRRSPFETGKGYTGDPSVKPVSANMKVIDAEAEGRWMKVDGATVRAGSALAKRAAVGATPSRDAKL